MTKKVGYKSPPDHTKWKPGSSGNLAGRKKGSRNFKTDLEEELAELVQVTEGGKPRRISKRRALIKSLMAKALKGDARAANAVLMWSSKLLGVSAEDDTDVDLTAAEQAAFDDLLDRRAAQHLATKNQGDSE